GVHKGLKDLVALGWIDKMPRIFGVQAEGSNYIAEAWETGEDIVTKAPIKAQTKADSISAGLPRDRIKGLRAVTETDGAYVTVSDEAILAAIPTLAQGSGVFAEPAGAAAYAGLQKAVEDGLISAESRIVVINTGNGLKDVKGAMAGVELSGNRVHSVAPNLAAVMIALNQTN
ncbi:MAG: threonine synthase, partial [Candidatus Promineifilaceae bacterium]